MTIRTIFVPVRGDGKGESVLNGALALASRFNAHIEVNHCRPKPDDMLPLGTYLNQALRKQITDSASNMADEEEKHLKEIFETYCSAHDLAVSDTPPWPTDRTSVAWRERTGKQAAVVSQYGRLADIVAVAQPESKGSLGHNTLEAAIFSTGRLVLVCPPELQAPVGGHVAIAWNGSAEAARAIYMALPVLAAADQVTMLCANAPDEPVPGPHEAEQWLATHGVSINIETFTSSGPTVGNNLLSMSRRLGVDTLLMGAYGQSRQRELIMGGVTRHVADNAEIAVLLVH